MNYSFSIRMSTRIKRLSFAMLYCKAKSKHEEFRKESSLSKENFVLLPDLSFPQIVMIRSLHDLKIYD